MQPMHPYMGAKSRETTRHMPTLQKPVLEQTESESNEMTKYFFNNTPYPRVTEILTMVTDDEGLRRWRERTPNHGDISKRAMTLGSLMHWVIANELSPVPIEMDKEIPMDTWPEGALEEVSTRLTHFRRLRMEFDRNPVLEHVVHHDEEGEYFAGTCDYRGNINGQRALADWKGSKRIRPEYTLQLGAYYVGSLREGYEAERGFVVRLQRDEKEVLELDHAELREAGTAFLDLARRWHRKNLSQDTT